MQPYCIKSVVCYCVQVRQLQKIVALACKRACLHGEALMRPCARAQARQLLTDPAVAREFARLRGEAEAKAGEARALQEELQGVHFSQESKAGRLLMAKCRALQVCARLAVLCRIQACQLGTTPPYMTPMDALQARQDSKIC